MNIEFHYYTTYLIATLAGFPPKEAVKLAHSCQMVDDNCKIYNIGGYKNYISQTSNILKPKRKLLRIYPLFHFIPGDFAAVGSRRKDGKMHLLNVTPGSANAKKIFNEVRKKGDLYSLGIACHSYADTFAHQNFVGYYEEFNAMVGFLGRISPNIGHADALTCPDQVGLKWSDIRLIQSKRVNDEIFMDAAVSLFLMLDGEVSKIECLKSVLSDMFSFPLQASRIEFVKNMSESVQFGGERIPDYDKKKWLNESSACIFFYRKKKKDFNTSDWFKFQEAVKWYQNLAWKLLKRSVFDKMDLKNL
jgi:hypothetical protein